MACGNTHLRAALGNPCACEVVNVDSVQTAFPCSQTGYDSNSVDPPFGGRGAANCQI